MEWTSSSPTLVETYLAIPINPSLTRKEKIYEAIQNLVIHPDAGTAAHPGKCPV
jgi:hypothetical protein